MKVEIFRKTETAELQGASLHESYYPPLPPESYGPGATPFPPPFTPEDREYPIRELVKAIDLGPCGGLSYERHYYIFADPLLNELLDNQQREAAFRRDMVEGREKEASNASTRREAGQEVEGGRP